MLKEKIDALIEAGWRILETDLTDTALDQWREEARNCLLAFKGDDSGYTDYFTRHDAGQERLSLLTGVGVLSAVQLGHSPRDNLVGVTTKNKDTVPHRERFKEHDHARDSHVLTFQRWYTVS